MKLAGGCHCGAIRYEVDGQVDRHALCHCEDCRRHSGAPMVGWAIVGQERLHLKEGKPVVYRSSQDGRRHFCGTCGTGLFYFNDVIFPGQVDVQTSTFDDPEQVLAPQANIQLADQVSWMRESHALPGFDRYPAG
jgi:hypothetical protein